ncbi:hypothetical protein ASF92_13010 [Pedobacter sp. Leaf176]|nr:hypothetical protein ASF92_13010 [Pedobacter sp. Leaf176]
MLNSALKSVMLFRLSPEKILELGRFIHSDSNSLIVLTSVREISSGAVFEEKSSLEILFEQFEKHADSFLHANR